MEEVKIPIIFQVNDGDVEKELPKLHSKLIKLKSSMDAIFKDRSENIKLFDTAKIVIAERQLAKIRDRLKQITDEEKQDSSTSAMMEKNIQLYKDFATQLDLLINKYPELRNAMLDIPKDWGKITNPKELLQYVEALNGRLQQTRQMLESTPKGDDILDASRNKIEQDINALQQLISKIGEYQQKLANARDNAAERTKEVSIMKKDGGYSDEAIEAQKRIAKAARDAYAELQKSSGEATNALKRDIKERIAALQEEEKAYGERIQELKRTKASPENSRRASNRFRFEDSAAVNDATDANEKFADSNKKVSKSSKDAASTLYYQLRAFKMLGFVVNSAQASMDKFGRKSIDVAKKTASAYAKLLPGVSLVSLAMKRNAKSASTFGKGLGKIGKDIKSHTKDVKSATQEHNHFNFSLKSALKTILAYGLGIRSLYMLMRKLRSAISSGFEEMAQQFDDVNQKMSSIVSSINYIKASLTAMVEPLLGVIAPALEKISEIVANISYHVASFIAALTGQTAVYKAIRVQTDYAKSLDKTAEKAKKAKKELAGFDELNVLHSDDDDEDSKDYTMGWELVPVLEEAFPLLDKIKDILSKLFEPLKNAWEKMKDFVIDSFKFMVEKLKSLLKTIWDDFLKVWQEEATQKIFENLLKILGDIFLIIGYIAEAIEEAWRHNENGLRILRAIRDIIGIIVDALMRCADATVEWAKNLNLIPLFDAIADVLEKQVVPAVQKIADLFVYLYINAVLPLAKYLIEEFAPVIVRAFGDVAEAIGNIAKGIQTALETNDIMGRIVTGIKGILDIIAEGFAEIARLTKEWSERLDFVPLFETFADVLNRQVVPALRQVKDLLVYLFDKVILSTAEYIIETLGPIILSIAGNISELIGIIAEKLRLAFEENNRGTRIVTALHGILTLIAEAIDRCTEKTAEWANKLQLSPLVETFTQVLETQVLPAVSKIVGLFEHLYNDIILEIVRYAVEQFGPAFVQIFGNISETVGIIADRFRMASEENDRGSQILEKIEGIISYIMDKIIQVSEKTKEWASNLDFAPLLDAINRNLDSIKPLIEFIVDTVGKFWTDVLLPFWTYIIEKGGPALLDVLGKISSNIKDWDSVGEKVDELFAAFEKFLELGWETLLQILEDIGLALTDFVQSDKLQKIVDGFKAWLESASPEKLASQLEKFVKTFAEVYAGLTVVSKVIMPVITGFMTLGNVFLQTGLISSIKGLTTAIGGGAAGSGAGLVGSLGSIAGPVLIVVAVLGTMVAAFGGVKGTIEELKKQFDLIKESVTQFAEGLNFQATLDNLKTSFDSLGDSVQLLAPIFDLVLTVIGEQIASLIKGALGLIDGILQAFDGVVTFFNGMAAIVDGFVALLTGNHKLAMDNFGEGISKLFIGVAEVVGGAINSIAEAIAGFVGVVCPDAAKGILDFVNMTKGVFKSMKEAVTVETEETATKVVDDFNDMNTGVTTIIGTHTLEQTGSDYIKGFETGEVSAFESFRSQYDKSLDDLVSDTQNVINENTLNPPGKDYISGLNEGIYSEYEPFNTHYMQSLDELLKENTDLFNSDTLYKPGNEFITGLDTGVKDEWPNFSQTTDTNLQELTDKMSEVINDETLREPGQNYIKGLHDAMMFEWAELREDIDYSIGQLMATFQSRLNSEALYDVGANLIRGLREGLMSELEETLERVREICEEIKETAEEAFEVASPSKVFFRIGGFLMQGMAEGINEDADMPIESMNTVNENLMATVDTMMTSISDTFNGESSYNLGASFVQGLQLGINDYWVVFTESFLLSITAFTEQFMLTFGSENSYLVGMNFVTGLQTGITEYWLIFTEFMTITLTDFMLLITTYLSTENFYMLGISLLQAMELGMTEYLPVLIENLTNICNTITDAVRTAFGTMAASAEGEGENQEENAASSEIYAEIGRSLMSALGTGIEEASEEVLIIINTVFENINKSNDTFAKTIINKIKENINNVTKVSKKFLTDTKELISKFYDTTINVTADTFMDLETLTQESVDTIVKFIEGILNKNTLVLSGQLFIQGFIEGMASRNSELIGFLDAESNMIVNAFTLGEASAVDVNEYSRNLEKRESEYTNAYNDVMKQYSADVQAINKKYQREAGESGWHVISDQYGHKYQISSGKASYEEASQIVADLRNKYEMMLTDVRLEYSDVIDSSNRKTKGLNDKTLYRAGQQLIQGLIEGMKSMEDKLFAYVETLCTKITERFKSALGIHSPSKETQLIGEFLMLGLQKGIDDNKSDVENDFSDIDLALDDKMENKFIDHLVLMKNEAIDIISEMSNSIEDIMSNLDIISSIQEMHSSLNKLGNINVPNIAVGKILPSASAFTQKQSDMIDYKRMANAVKDAMIESMSDMRYNNSESGDIVLQVDGYELFRATRNQNDIYRYSTGVSAF